MARIWLQVTEHHDGPGFGFPSELWWRDAQIEGQPSVGDDMFFLKNGEDPEGSVETDVRKIYWSIDGVMNMELRSIVRLPNADMEQYVNNAFLGSAPVPMMWREEEERLAAKTLEEELIHSGWHKFSELPSEGRS